VTVTSERSGGFRAAAIESTWRHLPALDGLRAAAVIAVLLFHGGYLEGGFLGVDLFFALSGFLITSLLIRDATGAGSGGRGIDLLGFWGRRFRRLLPAVLTMIAVVALWSWIFGSAADLEGVKRDGPWAVVYLANWHFIAESGGYWASFAQPSMFDHLWSLAIEEQFYVLWPLVVLAIWTYARRPQGVLLWLSIAGAIASVVTMFALYSGGDPTRVYMGTDTRASSLLVGAIAATAPARALVQRVVALLGGRIDVVIAAIGALVLWSWWAVDGASAEALYRGGLFVHSLACAALVALVATVRQGPSVTALGWAPLAWIGTMSYGLYLWHWPVYVVLSPERTGIDGLWLLFIRIAVSGVIAYASFRLVEDPLRRRVTWVRGGKGVVALVVSIVGLLALLFALPDPDAEIAAFDPTEVSVPAVIVPPTLAPSTAPPDSAAADTSVSDSVPDAATPETTVAVVVPSPPPVAPPAVSSLLWVGDSVAYDISPAFEAALGAAGVAADGGGAFPGLRITGNDDSIRLPVLVPEQVIEHDADTVLMQVSSWDAAASDAEYADALAEMASAVGEVGARLVVVTAPPVGNDDLQSELDRLAEVAAGAAAATGDFAFLDAAAVWASPPVLDANGDGAPERKRDLVHVCPAGAASFAAWLTLQLDAGFDGITPADPASWAGAEWVTDPRFDDPAGACAPVG